MVVQDRIIVLLIVLQAWGVVVIGSPSSSGRSEFLANTTGPRLAGGRATNVSQDLGSGFIECWSPPTPLWCDAVQVFIDVRSGR